MKTLHVGKGIDLPLSFVTQTAAILAMRGRGKTHLGKVIAEEMLKQNQQIIVGDPTGAWWGLTSSASGKREGFPVVVFGGEHGVLDITPESGEIIADATVNERISVVLDLSGFEHDAPKIRFMSRFARRLFHLNRRPVHLFLDEADEFVPQNPDQVQVDMLAILKRIWQRGRIKGIGGTLISQRSAVVHKTLLSQSSMLIALQTVGPQDRAALKAWFESWGNEKQIHEFTSTISNLPKHQAWFWSPELNIFTRGKARPLETFDSSKTPDIEHGETGPSKRAEIDVKKLGAQIAKLADESKANDPAELKKRVAELERQKASWKPVAKTETKIQSVHVPFMSPRIVKAVQKYIRQIEGHRKDIERAVHDYGTMTMNGNQLLKSLSAALAKAEALTLSKPIHGTVETARAPKLKPISEWPKAEAIAPRRPFDPPDDKTWRAGGEKRILTVLAQHGGVLLEGRARVLARINKPGSFATYVGRLVKAAHVTRNNDKIEITRSGLSAVGTVPPLPSGRELIEWWKQEVGTGGEGRIFALLLDNPKHVYTIDNLAGEFPQYTPGSISTYIGRLVTLGLVERSRDGVQLALDFADVA